MCRLFCMVSGGGVWKSMKIYVAGAMQYGELKKRRL